MSNTGKMIPYFPPLHGTVDCGICERADCVSREKFQRSRRDFSYTSGRCPRLPDKYGAMEDADQAVYEKLFPLVYAELGAEKELFLYLTLPLPHNRRQRRVYRSRYGQWYYRERMPDGNIVKRIITIHGGNTKQEILNRMEETHANRLLLRCKIGGVG